MPRSGHGHAFRTLGIALLVLLSLPLVLLLSIFLAPVALIFLPLFLAWGFERGVVEEQAERAYLRSPASTRVY